MEKEINSFVFLSGQVLVTFLSVTLIAISFSCEKEGPAGLRGETGSANVIYSEWFTPEEYTDTTVFGIKNFNYNKPVSGITQEILDSGVILTYGKLSGYNALVWPANQVAILPISVTYISGASSQTDTWSAYAVVGNLRINFVNNTNLYSSIANSHVFRYIIIPGGSAESLVKTTDKTANLSRVGFNWMTYDEVCEYLNIPE